MEQPSDAASSAAEAITTLLCSRDVGAQRLADAWLASFAATPAAWSACVQMLSHGAAEVSYFAANVLLTKVRREWGALPPAERAPLLATLSAALLPCAGAPLAARRLCLALAAAAARGEAEGAAALAAAALALAPARPDLALALLAALAEEADEAPARRRGELAARLGAAALPGVLALCSAPHTLATQPGPALAAALRWLRLHPDGAPGGADSGGRLLLSPAALATAAPALLPAAYAALAHPDPAAAGAAAELAAEAHGPGAPRDGDPRAEQAAAEEAIAHLCALRARAQQPDGLPVARCVGAGGG